MWKTLKTCKLHHSIVLPPDFKASDNQNPIVVLHALFGNSINFKFMVNSKFGLLEKRKPVIFFDLRNHGLSEYSNSMKYDEMSQDVLTVFNTLSLNKVSLIGHSMGGKIAMNIALNYPKLVEKLFILDIAPVTYLENPDWDIPIMVEAMRQLDLEKVKVRKDADDLLKNSITDERKRMFFLTNLVKEEEKWRWRVNLDGIEKNVQEIGSFPKNEGKIFTNPTLFLRGGKSFRLDQKYHQETLSKFPNAKIETLEKGGHWLHVDDFDGFQNSILNFF